MATTSISSLSLSAAVCVALIAVCLKPQGATAVQDTDDNQSNDLRKFLSFLQDLLGDETKTKLSPSQDTELPRKRSCAIGAGMTHHCTMTLVDKTLSMRDRLRSGASPGKKRSAAATVFDKDDQLGMNSLATAGTRQRDVHNRHFKCEPGKHGCRIPSETFNSFPVSNNHKFASDYILPDSSLIKQILFGRVVQGANVVDNDGDLDRADV